MAIAPNGQLVAPDGERPVLPLIVRAARVASILPSERCAMAEAMTGTFDRTRRDFLTGDLLHGAAASIS